MCVRGEGQRGEMEWGCVSTQKKEFDSCVQTRNCSYRSKKFTVSLPYTRFFVHVVCTCT